MSGDQRLLRSVPESVRPVVLRQDLVTSLLRALTGERTEEDGPLTVALRGPGGIGKTTLAQSVYAEHAHELTERFPGGILWVTIGRNATGAELAEKINELSERFSGQRPGHADPGLAGAQLGNLLAGQDVLIIVDDVWEPSQLFPFLFGGEAGSCVRLVTTRDPKTLPREATVVDVHAMTLDEAAAVLAQGLAGQQQPPAQLVGLAKAADKSPLSLTLINGALASAVRAGQPLGDAADNVAGIIGQLGGSATATVYAALRLLDEDVRERYLELAIFPEDIPEQLLELYWPQTGGIDEEAVADIRAVLTERNLATSIPGDGGSRALRIHDVLHDHIRERVQDRGGQRGIPGLNGMLLDAAERSLPRHPGSPAPWWDLPPGSDYLLRRLAFHLKEAGRIEEMTRVIRDLRWIAAKLTALGPVAVQADLTRLADDPIAGPLGRKIATAAHLLTPTEPPDALTGILLSRLDGIEDEELNRRVSEFAEGLHTRRLANRWPLPDLPHPALDQVLRSTSGTVRACAMSPDPDDPWLATGGTDGIITVWDTATGDILTRLVGHRADIWGLTAVDHPGGHWLVSASDDRSIRVWDMTEPRRERGTERQLQELTGLLASWTCAADPGGAWVAAGDSRGQILIWDTRTWQVLSRPAGHQAAVWFCVAGPEGRWLATGGEDMTVRIWDPGTGEQLAELSGHVAAVWDAAASADGGWLVTGDSSGMARAWKIPEPEDLTEPWQLWTTWGTGSGMRSCAAALDGSWLATGDPRGTVQVWDMPADHAQPRLRLELSGHQGDVMSCVASPDGRRLITGGANGEIRIWNMDVKQTAGTVRRSAGIQACCADRRDPVLATADAGGEIRVWDVATERVTWRPEPHQGDAWSSELSADGVWLATTGTDGKARVWERARHRLAITLDHPKGLWACAFNSDASRLATADSGGTIRIWDWAAKQIRMTLEGHTAGVWACGFSPDDTWMASPSDDETIRIWDLADGETSAVIDYPCGAWICPISPDGTKLAVGGTDGIIRVYDPNAPESEPDELRGHVGAIWWLDFTPDGRSLLSGSDDGTVRIWDLASMRQMAILRGHTAPVWAIAVSGDGTWFASCDAAGTTVIWDAATLTVRALLEDHPVGARCCLASPDGSWIAAAGGNAEGRSAVLIRDTGSAQIRMELAVSDVIVRDCTLSHDGRWLAAAADDGSVRIWDLRGAETGPHAVLEHPGPVWACALGPDGTWAVTGDATGIVRRWHIPSGTVAAQWQAHPTGVRRALISSSGDQVITCGNGGGARIWDAIGGREQYILPHRAAVWTCAISPDGSWLGTGDTTGVLRIWNLADGTLRGELCGHGHPLRGCAISPDGRLLASVDAGGEIRVWDAAAGRCETMMRVEQGLYACTWLADGGTLCVAGVAGTYLFRYLAATSQ